MVVGVPRCPYYIYRLFHQYGKPGWFIGGCVLCGIFLVIFIAYMIIRKNKNQLKWKMKEHEKEVDEEKIRFLINVSHELRTPLTLVYAPLKEF